jgi:Protein of unknown function (DUF3486)
MPARSKVAMLPKEVRNELERRIVERSFSGYRDLADWLQAQGYHIAHDSIQRHGARLARKIEAMERLDHEAHAIAAATNHANTTVVEVAIQLIHHRVLALLLEEPERSEGSHSASVPEPNSDSARGQALGLADLARITRILADLNRITIQRQHEADAGGRQHRQPSRALRPTRAETAGKGLSEEAYQAIRNALLGIDPFDPEDRERSQDESAPAHAPERHEPEDAEGSNNPDADARAADAEESSCAAAAPSLPEPPADAAEGPQTQQDANSQSFTLKTGRLSALQGETVPVAAPGRRSSPECTLIPWKNPR